MKFQGIILNLIMFLSILLSFLSCSTWEEKDFLKDIKKSEQTLNLENGKTEKDSEIIEKFEVHPVKNQPLQKNNKTALEQTRLQKPPLERVLVLKKRNDVPKSTAEQEPKKSSSNIIEPPKDYPPELVEINQRAKKVWDNYQSNHHQNQQFVMDINYLGMTVGKIMITNKGKKNVNNKEVWHFHARFKSAPFYSRIYELDDTVDTFVTTDRFLSSRFSLIQRESKQNIDDLQLYDRDQYKTFWFYHQKKSDGKIKNKKVVKPIPYYSLDPFSVVFFYQGLPLKNGDSYEIPLINKGKVLVLRSEVEGRENIKTSLGFKNAIRVHATTKYSGSTLKSGEMYFWFSDDSQRLFLKAQAKIKIGSVTADIVN